MARCIRCGSYAINHHAHGREGDHDEFAVRDANARLIAAAPDLLKALRSIAAITTCADQDQDAMCAEIQGICRKALAARERGGKA